MKFAAFILALIIMSASIDPVPSNGMLSKENADKCFSMAAGHCMRKKNCTNNKNNTSDKSKNDCQNGACSPFAICNCFPAVVASYKDLTEAYYKSVEKKSVLFKEDTYSSYYASCWHPPELI